ncbi:MAG: metal ABC transporter substrate-binding protein [Betaproteobacteria bacterium]
MKSFLHTLTLLGLLFLGPATAVERIQVVASFSILGDLVKNIGGKRINLHTLVGENSDAHVYQPTPADAKLLARAQLVVVNGFGFEGWIDRLIKSSGYRGKVVVAGNQVKTLQRSHSKTHSPGDHDQEADPHAWQDLSNAVRYVDNIEKALSEVDPAGIATYHANASQYKNEITALDSQIRKAFSAIPAEQRRIVTSHDAFGYFGRAYGVTFISPIGVNTDAEPSAGDIGRIIQQIRREKIPAIFMESISDPRLLERIRAESGAKLGGTLFSDSLSKADGPAATYLEMMRHNSKVIAAALKN